MYASPLHESHRALRRICSLESRPFECRRIAGFLHNADTPLLSLLQIPLWSDAHIHDFGIPTLDDLPGPRYHPPLHMAWTPSNKHGAGYKYVFALRLLCTDTHLLSVLWSTRNLSCTPSIGERTNPGHVTIFMRVCAVGGVLRTSPCMPSPR
ncbi:hypothetical protein LshimejAT787_2400110 [Lyophyllum shimeji]|uniref:Uncharacterized protein n=1 Tax=Lyophyllum shimeji TaxID=47721 RepID=A0A9P3Q0T2_LYOSH|nr:hypothetical protein LshimejAT787_2400110 [Lyophyllum shimeji]